MENNKTKTNYYLDINYKLKRLHKKIKVYVEHLKNIASLSESSTLKVGALAVKKNFERDFNGYNGSVRNAKIYEETGTEECSLEPGESGFIHAEMNLIAKFREYNPENYVVLLTHSPCSVCAKLLVNAGFKNVFWLEEYRETDHLDDIFNGRLDYYGKIEDLFKGDFALRVFYNLKI